MVSRISGREKILNAALALLILFAGVWAFLRYAPLPYSAKSEQEVKSPQPAPPAQAASAAAEAKESAGMDQQPLANLLGQAQAHGHATASAPEYVSRMEADYIARGYRNFNPLGRIKGRGKSAVPAKPYWRNQAQGSEMIFAVGEDANPHDAAHSPDARMYITVATPDAKAETNWITYLCLHEALKWDAKDDFPGQDPPGVPRPGGMRRLFGFGSTTSGQSSMVIYSSERGPDELESWYRSAMPPSWNYEETASREARQIGSRVNCFTQGGRFCLVWISGGVESRSLVIISVHGN